MVRVKAEELLSPRAVADALGVSESSIKRWSDDGLLAMQKTAGGHRKLARAEVLRFVREHGYDISKPELLGLARVATHAPQAPIERTIVDSLLGALVAGDSETIRRQLVGMFASGVPLTTLADELVGPALRALGDRWEHGDVRVFEEHRAIELVRRALHEIRQLLPRLPRGRRPTAVLTTLTGDPYTIATTLAELVLVDAGWFVTNLGASTPAHAVSEATASLRPRLLAIGINWTGDVDALVASYVTIADAARAQRTAIVIGGAATSPGLRARIHFATCCATMRELRDFADTLAPRRAP